MSQGPIVENLLAAGLEKDCPFAHADAARGLEAQVLTAETVNAVSDDDFMSYTGTINTYLQVCSYPYMFKFSIGFLKHLSNQEGLVHEIRMLLLLLRALNMLILHCSFRCRMQ